MGIPTTVSVRYIVDDVELAVDFYRERLGFVVDMHPAATFAMLSRGPLQLLLSAPSERGGGGQITAAGRPSPGGWNRFQLPVEDLTGEIERLRAAGVRFRGDRVHGIGGDQVMVEDPSGNPVELFQSR
jgi:catechol 2,3-dioxygenase-like lactoylglutathione lyase family enzyme